MPLLYNLSCMRVRRHNWRGKGGEMKDREESFEVLLLRQEQEEGFAKRIDLLAKVEEGEQRPSNTRLVGSLGDLILEAMEARRQK
jgi:hypothetical protein